MAATPTIPDRLTARARELDQAISSALACGEWKELERLPTGAAKVITAHLLDLRARVARLNADIAGIVAVARAMAVPPDEAVHL